MPYVVLRIIGFAAFGYVLVTTYLLGAPFYLLSVANFVIHEAGHGLTGIAGFGRIWVIAAGSIFEIGVPACFALYGFLSGQPVYAGGSLAWMATACYSVSVYAADASKRELTLAFFNNPDHHDWGNLLQEFNMLHLDAQIAAIFWGCGLAVGVLGLAVIAFYPSRTKTLTE